MKTWNQISQTQKVSRSQHTGRPILENLNTVYGYYATIEFLSEEKFECLLQEPEYTGEKHPAEIKFDNSAHLCG